MRAFHGFDMAVGSVMSRRGVLEQVFLNLPQHVFVWCLVGAVSIGAVLEAATSVSGLKE